MRHIYVAGPYSTDPGQNVHNATRAATELLDAGLRPYLPHLTHFWNASFPRDYEVWMALDLAWLGKCEAMVRLPGHSPGADREEAEAKRLGIPVFASTREAIEWAGRFCHHCRHPQDNHGPFGCRACQCDVPFGTEDGYPPLEHKGCGREAA